MAEALGLAWFFDARERMQHRAKVQYATPAHLITTQRLGREAGHSLARFVRHIVKYPTLDEVTSEQGVGPHFDANFLTFVSPPLLFFDAYFFLFPIRFGFVVVPSVLPKTISVCGATRQSIAIRFSSIQ